MALSREEQIKLGRHFRGDEKRHERMVSPRAERQKWGLFAGVKRKILLVAMAAAVVAAALFATDKADDKAPDKEADIVKIEKAQEVELELAPVDFETLRDFISKGDKSGFEKALEGLPDINMRGEEGASIAHLVAEYGDYKMLKILHQAGADLTLLDYNGESALHLAFASYFSDSDMIELLIEEGNDLHLVNKKGVEPFTRALMRGHEKFFEWGLERDLDINPVLSTGLRLWDSLEAASFDDDLRDFLKENNRTESVISDVLKEYPHDIEGFLKYFKTPMLEVKPASKIYFKGDFVIVPQFGAQKNISQGRKMPPTILVAEYSIWGMGDDSHIKNTSRVASGWVHKLSGGKSRVKTIAAEANITLPSKNPFLSDGGMMALSKHPAMAKGDIIISRSIGDGGKKADERLKEYIDDKWKSDYHPTNMVWRKISPIIFNSVGNDQHYGDKFSSADNFLLGRRAAFIGGADPVENGWKVPHYSENNPLFVMPTVKENGRLYEGTSFHAPAAAGLYAALAERHPELSYEEIIFSIMASADNRIGAEKEARLDFAATGSGLFHHKRAGFGVADGVAADKMAAAMAGLKVNVACESAKDFMLELKEGVEKTDDGYLYPIRISADMRLTSLSVNLHFKEKRGFAEVVMPNGQAADIRLSTNANGRSDRFFGTELKKGDYIYLRTKEPLKSQSDRSWWEKNDDWDGSFVNVRGVDVESRIGQVLVAAAKERAASKGVYSAIDVGFVERLAKKKLAADRKMGL